MNIDELTQQGQSFLVANDGQFLGILTLCQYNSESISNSNGSFGNQYSATSIKNQYSQYGSPYSSLSPYNQYSNTPPTIYINGEKYGFLSKNIYISGNVIDPDDLNDLMLKKNLNK